MRNPYAGLRGLGRIRAPDANPATIVSDLFVILLVIVVIVGAATGAPLVAALGALAFVVTIVARTWSRLSLEDVSYRSEGAAHRAFIGDEIDLTLTLENRKPLPVPWLRVTEFVPLGLEVAGEDSGSQAFMGGTEIVNITSLGRYERVRIRHRIRALERGLYRLGPARLDSGDLFGLYSSKRIQPPGEWRLVVYPRTVPMPAFYLPAARPIGDARSSVRLWEDPTRPNGVREYRPGDPVRRIDWKVTARRRELYVRTFDPTVAQYAVIMVEANTTEVPWEGYRSDVLEAAVTGAASVAIRALDLGYRVGLVTNGVPHSDAGQTIVRPARGPDQLPVIMESLAMVRPMTVRSLEAVAQGHGPEALPMGATVVYIAGRFARGTVRYMAGLARRGHPVIVLHVGLEAAPDLPGLRVLDARKLFREAPEESMFKRPGSRHAASLLAEARAGA